MASTALAKVMNGQKVGPSEKGQALKQSVSALERMRNTARNSNLRMGAAASSGGRVAIAGAAAGGAAYARGRMDKVDVKGVDVPLAVGVLATLAGIGMTAKGSRHAGLVTGLGEGLLIESAVNKGRQWGQKARAAAPADPAANANAANAAPAAPGEVTGDLGLPPIRRTVVEPEPAFAGRGGFERARQAYNVV